MSINSRFAPSPTGLLHIGTVRTALVAWLAARAVGGTFLLRLDDTDTERSRPEFDDAIFEDLKWLGLDWDRTARQSERAAQYDDAIELLKENGRVYACYETAEELALKRKSQLSRGQPPIYDRAGLSLSDADRSALETEGRRPHWRFLMNHEPITWEDRVRGPTSFHGRDISDPVVLREDGRPLYHLCSVVDDADFDINLVVRAEDHVTNTAAHIQMFEALGFDPPGFAHPPLIADRDGRSLSKRLGSLSIRALRAEWGLEPEAVTSLLARIGTSDPIEPIDGLEPLVAGFRFTKFARATPKFDPDELGRINAKILHSMPFDVVRERLERTGLTDADDIFWNAVRPNLSRLDEAADWWGMATEEIEPVVTEPDYVALAARLLPDEPWTHETWSHWTTSIRQESGRKGKALFMPLRLALTGRERGPELAALLPLIGRQRALARLTGAITGDGA